MTDKIQDFYENSKSIREIHERARIASMIDETKESVKKYFADKTCESPTFYMREKEGRDHVFCFTRDQNHVYLRCAYSLPRVDYYEFFDKKLVAAEPSKAAFEQYVDSSVEHDNINYATLDGIIFSMIAADMDPDVIFRKMSRQEKISHSAAETLAYGIKSYAEAKAAYDRHK